MVSYSVMALDRAGYIFYSLVDCTSILSMLDFLIVFIRWPETILQMSRSMFYAPAVVVGAEGNIKKKKKKVPICLIAFQHERVKF